MPTQLSGRGGEFVNRTAASVWIRRTWQDQWQYVPMVDPVNATAGSMPTGCKATLTYRYGKFIYPDIAAAPVTYLPEDINGWFVQILLHNSYNTWPIFTGQVVSLSDSVGGCAGGIERGEITYDAYGMEYLLRQYDIYGSYVTDYAGTYFIPRTLAVNGSVGYGEALPRTRSRNRGPAGVYTFGEEEYWSNYDFLEYILTYFQGDGMQWRITGNAAWTLRQIYRPLPAYEGKSVLDVVGALIDGYRGLGWRVYTDGQYPTIEIFSELAYPMTFTGGFSMPQNGRKTEVWDWGSALMDVEYSMSQDTAFDSITVVGDRVKMIGTYGFTYTGEQPGPDDIRVANLVPWWNRSLESAYTGDITDEDRKGTTFRDLWSLWGIARDTDWSWITPVCTPDGNIHIRGLGSGNNVTWGRSYIGGGLTFDRGLPFSPNWEDTTYYTDFWDENGGQPPLFVTTDTDNGRYITIDQLPVGIEISPDDRFPGWRFDTKDVPHLLAKGVMSDKPQNATMEPMVDVSKMVVTAGLTVDARPYIEYITRWKPAGSPRQPLVISIPCRVEYFAKTPIVRVEDGQHYVWNLPQIYRDERAYLAGVLTMAVAYYSMPRRPLSLTYRALDPGLTVGSVITGVRNAARFRESYSVVSAVQWDFRARTTKVMTADAQLDVVRLGMGGY